MECPDCGSLDAVQQACPRCACELPPGAVDCATCGPVSPEDQPISTVAAQRNTLPMIGFLCMLAGPAILFLAGILVQWLGRLPLAAASIVSWMALLLPAAGVVLSWVSLARWKHIRTPGRALAIVTIVMRNPFFYIVYFALCALSRYDLAGLIGM